MEFIGTLLTLKNTRFLWVNVGYLQSVRGFGAKGFYRGQLVGGVRDVEKAWGRCDALAVRIGRSGGSLNPKPLNPKP